MKGIWFVLKGFLINHLTIVFSRGRLKSQRTWRRRRFWYSWASLIRHLWDTRTISTISHRVGLVWLLLVMFIEESRSHTLHLTIPSLQIIIIIIWVILVVRFESWTILHCRISKGWYYCVFYFIFFFKKFIFSKSKKNEFTHPTPLKAFTSTFFIFYYYINYYFPIPYLFSFPFSALSFLLLPTLGMHSTNNFSTASSTQPTNSNSQKLVKNNHEWWLGEEWQQQHTVLACLLAVLFDIQHTLPHLQVLVITPPHHTTPPQPQPQPPSLSSSLSLLPFTFHINDIIIIINHNILRRNYWSLHHYHNNVYWIQKDKPPHSILPTHQIELHRFWEGECLFFFQAKAVTPTTTTADAITNKQTTKPKTTIYPTSIHSPIISSFISTFQLFSLFY